LLAILGHLIGKIMQCTKCNSDNTQRLEVVYEHGTQNINTHSHSAGAGIGGSFGVGGVTTRTSGVSQTMAGEKAAPPMRKSYKWPIIGLLLSTALLENIMLGGPLLLISAYFWYKAFTYNKTEWPHLYQHWQESWLCLKCGNIYHQP
jgi:hypothetical protein